MPYLLALETATDVCSVALMHDDVAVATMTLNRPRAHAEHLVPMIDEVLSHAGLEARSLEAVAVSMGPGSYTGLRIGVSTAKGLALAVGARLVGVPTLEALAARVAPMANPGDVVCALFRARQTEVYAAAFHIADDALQPAAGPDALPAADVPGWLPEVPKGRLWVAGQAGALATPVLAPVYGERLRVLPPDVVAPSAETVGRLGQRRLAAGQTEDPATFEPFYLKAFVARNNPRSVFERLPF